MNEQNNKNLLKKIASFTGIASASVLLGLPAVALNNPLSDSFEQPLSEVQLIAQEPGVGTSGGNINRGINSGEGTDMNNPGTDKQPMGSDNRGTGSGTEMNNMGTDNQGNDTNTTNPAVDAQGNTPNPDGDLDNNSTDYRGNSNMNNNSTDYRGNSDMNNTGVDNQGNSPDDSNTGAAVRGMW